MSPFDAQGQLIQLTALALALASGLAMTAPALLALRTIRDWSPDSQRTALLVVAAAPAVIAFAAFAAVMLPSLMAMMGAPDHCHDHGGHLHLCVVHFGEHPASALALGVIAIVAVYCAYRLFRAARIYLEARRVVRDLLSLARVDGVTHVIPTAHPICASVGLWSPRIIVSDGLLAALDADARRAAIAHESAHVAKRDALWRLVARALTRLYPGSVRARILGALDVAIERAADEHAARVVGDRLAVAQALIDAERLAMPDVGPLARAITGTSIGLRVKGLLDAATTAGRPRRLALVLGLLAASCLMLHDVLHHAVESLLAAVFH